ncbi:MAG TPA: hypothetical protein VH062_29010 [Polyangiaceae bacterium]|nr:hypothetical protein [Polyangiaceae bacterium]
MVPTKATYDDTRLLAKKSGFLWRAAHAKSEALVELVKGPALGDLMHFYFVEQRRAPRPVGTYELVGTEGHPHAAWFGEQIEGTALFRVTNAGFAAQLRTFGDYKEDPVLEVFTGWLLKPGAVVPPPLPPALVLGRATHLDKR